MSPYFESSSYFESGLKRICRSPECRLRTTGVFSESMLMRLHWDLPLTSSAYELFPSLTRVILPSHQSLIPLSTAS